MFTYIYGVRVTEDTTKYFTSEKEARDYAKTNAPLSNYEYFGKVSKHELNIDRDHNMTIKSGDWGMPKIIKMERSGGNALNYKMHEERQKTWFDL